MGGKPRSIFAFRYWVISPAPLLVIAHVVLYYKYYIHHQEVFTGTHWADLVYLPVWGLINVYEDFKGISMAYGDKKLAFLIGGAIWVYFVGQALSFKVISLRTKFWR